MPLAFGRCALKVGCERSGVALDVTAPRRYPADEFVGGNSVHVG